MSEVRILVVDDDPGVLEAYAGELAADARFECTVASSIREARVCLQDAPFDAFVVDLVLADGDGISLISDVQAATGRHVPAVLITAHDGTQVKVDALRAGIDTVMIKPVDGARLREALRALLRLDVQR